MLRALLSAWSTPGAPGARGPARRDVMLAVTLITLAVGEAVLRTDTPWRWLSLAVLVVMAMLLPWRRTQPLSVTLAFSAVALGHTLVTGGAQIEYGAALFALLFPFSLARWGSGRAALIGLAVFVSQAGVSIALERPPAGTVVGGAAVVGAAIAVGVAARLRSRLAEQRLVDARRGERERLARDLHDTVAHHLSAIAVSAQAGLAVADTRPDAARDALRRIESEASRALAESRRVVRGLRDGEPAEVGPGRGVDDLRDLSAPAGPGPEVVVDAPPIDGLPSPVAAALYRIAQESVTNARRHARGVTRVTVTLTDEPPAVRLTVLDDGHSPAPAVAGFGIVGMTERAELLGGHLECGPSEEHGWRVVAVLPREER